MVNAKTLRDRLEATIRGHRAAPIEMASRLSAKAEFTRFPRDTVYEAAAKWAARAIIPEDAPEGALSASIDVAHRAMAFEMYGEVYEQLNHLMLLLFEERYRDPDSPVMQQMAKLLELTRA